MASKLKLLSLIIVPLLVSPTLGTELTYKEYVKSIRDLEARLCIWDLAVYVCRAQPDEEAPLPG